MRIVFLGPPGSGKGTQAQKLAQKLDIPQISSGDLLREAVQRDTPVGRKANEYMKRGELVPDDVVIDVVNEGVEGLNQFILDGFPRNVYQAEVLDRLLKDMRKPLDAVVTIDVPLERLIERLSGRLTCSTCSTIYHRKYNPPRKEGICDVCGGSLYERADDTEAAITHRFKTYTEKTEPLIQHYRKKGKLITIDGTHSIEDISLTIEKALKERGIYGV